MNTADVGQRQVRRILAERVEVGYLRWGDSGAGVANVYDPAADPGSSEVDLPGLTNNVSYNGL